MIYTYCGITADAALWYALGYDVRNEHGKQDTEIATSHHIRYDMPYKTEAIQADLISARINSGFTDDRALVYLINQRTAEQAERARNHAVETQARATVQHADAIIHAARINRQAEEIRMGLRKDVKG